MIFQHTIDKVLSGEKTQTRRRVKPNHVCWADSYDENGATEITDVRVVIDESRPGRKIYEVGKTYAVQPARGKPAVARIRITDIRREDVRNISDEDALAEGFGDRESFLELWVEMHDPSALLSYQALYRDGAISAQPAERYDAWVLTFEFVKAAQS